MQLFKTNIADSDIRVISEVLKEGSLGFGPNVGIFEKEFKVFSGKSNNIGTNSASASAFMLFAYLKEKYGSCDIYTPSIGFTCPAWAAQHHGHNIIWVEVDNNLLFNIDDYKQKRRLRCEGYSDGGIKPVLMPILYGGVSNIEGFDDIHKDGYNEIIVVDSAHCVTPKIKSDFIFFSFHPYKPVAASDGGMISTEDEKASEWFRNYRNFGRINNNSGYDIEMEGFKFYMNNLNATIALTQLRKYPNNLSIRKKNHILLEQGNLKGRLLPHDDYSSYYFGTLIVNKDNIEEMIRKYPTSKHYPLLHKTKYFNKGGSLPFTEEIHKYIVNIPLYENIHNS